MNLLERMGLIKKPYDVHLDFRKSELSQIQIKLLIDKIILPLVNLPFMKNKITRMYGSYTINRQINPKYRDDAPIVDIGFVFKNEKYGKWFEKEVEGINRIIHDVGFETFIKTHEKFMAPEKYPF